MKQPHFRRTAYEEARRVEVDRLDLVVKRDSHETAAQWALRTLRIYRRCLLANGHHGRPFHFASVSPFRERYLGSYRVMKEFVQAAEHAGDYGASARAHTVDRYREALKITPSSTPGPTNA